MAINGEPPLNTVYINNLINGITKVFDSEKSYKKDFLLVSTDFSHHSNSELTEKKDNNSWIFFNSREHNPYFCVCDNRPSIYVISKLLKPEDYDVVLYHTNSYEISGMDENDITSYFFSLFGRNK